MSRLSSVHTAVLLFSLLTPLVLICHLGLELGNIPEGLPQDICNFSMPVQSYSHSVRGAGEATTLLMEGSPAVLDLEVIASGMLDEDVAYRDQVYIRPKFQCGVPPNNTVMWMPDVPVSSGLLGSEAGPGVIFQMEHSFVIPNISEGMDGNCDMLFYFIGRQHNGTGYQSCLIYNISDVVLGDYGQVFTEKSYKKTREEYASAPLLIAVFKFFIKPIIYIVKMITGLFGF